MWPVPSEGWMVLQGFRAHARRAPCGASLGMYCEKTTHCCVHHCLCEASARRVPALHGSPCCCAPVPRSLRDRIQPPRPVKL